MNRAPHLQDERLFDCYLSVQNGDVLDPPVAEHLTDCDDCGERYAAMTHFLETLSANAAAEADAIFTPERLRAQQLLITRRLEHVGHPARVITFPGRRPSHNLNSTAPRSARRWVAAAAAAGLFIGVGTGLFLDWETRAGSSERRARAVVRQTHLEAPASVVEIPRPESAAIDEAFLAEIEVAGDRPRTRELVAFDELTPHVREVNLR
jgi:anti-sigma factor RsiW